MKIIKNITALSLISSILVLQAGVTLAATSEDRQSVDSQATVQMVQGGGKLAPLHIDHVTPIHFGKQPISGDKIIYNARYVDTDNTTENGVTKYLAPTIEIKDNRGTNAGWTLGVSVTDFTSGSDVLEGAELSLTPTTAYKYENPTAVPSNMALALTDKTQPIITAAENEGVGTSTYSFGEYSDKVSDEWAQEVKNEAVQLMIPGASAKVKDATYAATLTWVISDTP